MNCEKVLSLARTVYDTDFAPAAEERLLRFAALIEAQVRGDADRVIDLYEKALMLAFPDGASGDAFKFWNEARKAR